MSREATRPSEAVFLAKSYVDAEDTLYLYELNMPVPTEVFWNIGNGDVNAAPCLAHIYVHKVKLIVRNSWCVDSVIQTIYVNNNFQETLGSGTSDPNATALSNQPLLMMRKTQLQCLQDEDDDE